MGRSEPPDSAEIRLICEQILEGLTDPQIKKGLEEDCGKRDVRTIRNIRHIFLAGYPAIMGYLKKMGMLNKGQSGLDFDQFAEMVRQINKGMNPTYDEKTGKITYMGGLEF